MDNQIQFTNFQENEPKPKSNKFLIAILILLPLVMVALIGFKVFSDLKNQREKAVSFVEQQNEEQKKIIQANHLDSPKGQAPTQGIDENSPEFIVKDINNKFFTYVQSINNVSNADNCVNWKREDGVVFGLMGYSAQIYGDPNKDIGVSDKIQQIFIEKGYIKNAINTYDSRDKVVFGPGKTAGFEKGDTKCLLSWTTSNMAKDEFVISCGTVTSESEKNFKTFFSLLNNPVYFCVKNNNNQFASGIVENPSNESWNKDRWYAKNSGDTWSIAWQGDSSQLPCISVKDFPKDFYGSCK